MISSLEMNLVGLLALESRLLAVPKIIGVDKE
jgi:hypothetical protein